MICTGWRWIAPRPRSETRETSGCAAGQLPQHAGQVDQAQKDVDFNMVNFKRQEQLLTNNFTPRATGAARNIARVAKSLLAERAACRCAAPSNLTASRCAD
jgi:hypothetical protein